MKKILLIWLASLCPLCFNNDLFPQIVLQGTVKDNGSEFIGNGSEPVENVLVTLIDQTDTTRTFSDYTNEHGEYTIELDGTGVDDSDLNNPEGLRLLQNYPNPFNPSTVIPYELSRRGNVRIEIRNILGQKVRTLFDGFQTHLAGQVIWDGMDDHYQVVPAGVYIYSLSAEGRSLHKKMLLIDGGQSVSNKTLTSWMDMEVSDQHALTKPASDIYILRVTGENIETYEQQDLGITSNTVLDITVYRTVIDIDGNVYRTVKIGYQWWMQENLKVTHYCNGDEIPNVTDNTEWMGLETGAYCDCYNDENTVATYGRFYNWYSVSDPRGLAPKGWHVSTDAEWKELEMYLGMSQIQADSIGYRGTDESGKLKEAGTEHWQSPNTGATNESGFTALPVGFRPFGSGAFSNVEYSAFFWTSTEYPPYAWFRQLNYDNSKVVRAGGGKPNGCSVRCIRDYPMPVTLDSISISPKNIILYNNEDLQFSCTAMFSNDSTIDITEAATWSVSPGTAGSIDVSGLFTVHTTNQGTETIFASYNGKTSTAYVHVESIPSNFQIGTVTDIDGNLYSTVKIGDQWWMQENLKVTHYRNGDPIPIVTGDNAWSSLTTGAYCNPMNDENNVATYGRLYNWYAVTDNRNTAPEAWHVPSDEEWQILVDYLGGRDIAGGRLKEAGTTHWQSPNVGATNASGFSALPGGLRDGNGGFFGMSGTHAIFWSLTESVENDYAWQWILSNGYSSIIHIDYCKSSGFSIRCVKD